MCSGAEEGSYARLIDCVSLDSRLESNPKKKIFAVDAFEMDSTEVGSNFTSRKVFSKSFCTSRLPQKFVHLSFTIA